ncbi:hypothetical protein GUJ93_ZPchr0001g29710 [Zizania palustris]|uniref:NAB domain-containing protein n=1 Tax=Zizania palustris TaxID=103762 RepID=A0A8J5RZA5_ZIZPA|nr:hypothetical protein GUJ93_ZPchr0001g29710 [Zizania palustris]
METRVKAMIQLIEIEADTFARKAELYFKSRPDLVNYVEETYRSYQALADRYDRVSGELHKANHTIATAFPEQVQLSLQDDDGDGFPKGITGINISRGSIPIPKRTQTHRRISSHMSKDRAHEDIERLQKKILVLQTEKEFFKSSYESSLNKYLNIERHATEMQEEVWSLQEAFSTSAVIEDNEARALMVAQALISCEDKLASLQSEQKRSSEEATMEFQRVRDAKKKLTIFKSGCGHPHDQKDLFDHQDIEFSSIPSSSIEDGDPIMEECKLELQEISQKVKQKFESCSEAYVVHLAGQVDEFVDKVISLEIAASSQNAQINVMRNEADNLHKRLDSLESEKADLIEDSIKLSERLKQVEEVLQTIQRIEKSAHSENENIHKQLTEAHNSLIDFVEKLDAPFTEEMVGSSQETKDMDYKEDANNPDIQSESSPDDLGSTCKPMDEGLCDSFDDSSEAHEEEPNDTLAWQQLVLNGIEGKDKILLKDYACILRNYKDTNKQLSEIEKKNREYHLEAMSEMKELKIASATKDDEIRSLRQMLSSLQTKLNTSLPQCFEKSKTSEVNTTSSLEDKEIAQLEECMKKLQHEELHVVSLEEKFRAEISRVLEESIDFWLRFSTSYHYMQKFQKSFDKAKAEMDKLTDAKAHEGSDVVSSRQSDRKQESATLEKKFRDLSTVLQVWLEKNVMLQGELENRFSLLCSIEDEISKITTLDQSNEVHFTPFQAAKFQGEVSNMKQENNKVTKELQAGLDHVRGLQVEVGRSLLNLRENIELSIVRSNRAQHNFRALSVKAGVPLRTFLFGNKPKKASLFSCMGPVMPKPIVDMRSGLFR